MVGASICAEGGPPPDGVVSSQLLAPVTPVAMFTEPKVALVRIPARCIPDDTRVQFWSSSSAAPLPPYPTDVALETRGVGGGVEGLAIIVVTSPAPLHPDTSMLWKVLHSVDTSIPGLHECPVVIVCDGYKLAGTAKRRNPYSLSKCGFVQEEAARTYEAYKTVLQHELDRMALESTSRSQRQGQRQYVLLEMKEHTGFALSVKQGLLYAKNTYQSTHSLVLQHDRFFTTHFSSAFIPRCLRTFAAFAHVRYMGFTTTASLNYMAGQRRQFRSVWDKMQEELTLPVASQEEENPAVLLPMMFWYDSNHLVHIDRVLAIYTPFKTVPEQLHAAFGGKPGVRLLSLRIGDFIEDRLGQQQRNVFSSLAEALLLQLQQSKGRDSDEASLQQQREVLNQVVRLFGCYLVVPVETDSGGTGAITITQEKDCDGSVLVTTHTAIMHAKGRTRPAPVCRKMVDAMPAEERAGCAGAAVGAAEEVEVPRTDASQRSYGPPT